MADDVIERVAAALCGDHWPVITSKAAMNFWYDARDALSALRPGDVLPNGCVVVEKSMVDTMASFSCGCEGECEYIGGEDPIPDQCLALSACRKSNINMDRVPVTLPGEG